MEWKTLSQKYLIKRPWLTARVDQVELPTGAIIDEYYVLEYPDWVNTIAITKEGKFVFVRQYRYAIGKTVNGVVCRSDGEGRGTDGCRQARVVGRDWLWRW